MKKTHTTDGATRTTASPSTTEDPGDSRAAMLKKMRGFSQANDITSVMLKKANKVRQIHESFKQPFKPHGENP